MYAAKKLPINTSAKVQTASSMKKTLLLLPWEANESSESSARSVSLEHDALRSTTMTFQLAEGIAALGKTSRLGQKCSLRASARFWYEIIARYERAGDERC